MNNIIDTKTEIIYFYNISSFSELKYLYFKKNLFHILNLNINYNFKCNFILSCENNELLKKYNDSIITIIKDINKNLLKYINHSIKYNIFLLQCDCEKHSNVVVKKIDEIENTNKSSYIYINLSLTDYNENDYDESIDKKLTDIAFSKYEDFKKNEKAITNMSCYLNITLPKEEKKY